jgi:hypothetical protein
VKDAEELCAGKPASVAVIVKVALLRRSVGVPLIAPVVALIAKPAGRAGATE